MATTIGRQGAAEILNGEAAALAGIGEILSGLIAAGSEESDSLGVLVDRVALANERLSELAARISRAG